VGAVTVSDFITPAWYASGQTDYLNKLKPLTLYRGGYVSWIEGGDWWQAFMDDLGRITTRNLGMAKLGTRREKDELAAKAGEEA
jgi:nitrate reductase alpha subunit